MPFIFIVHQHQRRSLVEINEACSEGHLETCKGSDSDDGCNDCLKTDGAECPGCGTCFRPLERFVPDMEGICVPSDTLRDFVTAPVPPLFRLNTYYTALMSNYLTKALGDDVVVAINQAR